MIEILASGLNTSAALKRSNGGHHVGAVPKSRVPRCEDLVEEHDPATAEEAVSLKEQASCLRPEVSLSVF